LISSAYLWLVIVAIHLNQYYQLDTENFTTPGGVCLTLLAGLARLTK